MSASVLLPASCETARRFDEAPPFDDASLLRYSRHILLDEIGVEGQARLREARVLVVGLGGLGSPAALYLTAAGVGQLYLADADTVSASNLQRQILYTEADIAPAPACAKVDAACRTLRARDARVALHPIRARLAGEDLLAAVRAVDVVLDCSDNFPTRHAINRACVAARRPLISAAAVGWEGQFAVFDLRRGAPGCGDAHAAAEEPSACYHCLFPEAGEESDSPCATFGVFAPLVGILGTLQAAEALKCLLGMPLPLGQLRLLDLRSHEWRTLRFHRDPSCPVCVALSV